MAHYAGPVRYHTAGLVEKNKVRLGHGPWGPGYNSTLSHCCPYTQLPIVCLPPEYLPRTQVTSGAIWLRSAHQA